jgi:hypothetical protein
MGKQKKRYLAWAESEMDAWLAGDVESSVACFSADGARISLDPFGDHSIVQGGQALRKAYEEKAANWHNKKVISLEVLSANEQRAVIHAWKSWTTSEGEEKACTYIQLVKLDKRDQCTEYREWNMVKIKNKAAVSADLESKERV